MIVVSSKQKVSNTSENEVEEEKTSITNKRTKTFEVYYNILKGKHFPIFIHIESVVIKRD
ncbi:hypothetical protein [Staphylococcus caprae]|uniref:hypothetical protein n=1 Tax=Staphylococcus caprae TaxID=29380 RepID=UPI003B22228E